MRAEVAGTKPLDKNSKTTVHFYPSALEKQGQKTGFSSQRPRTLSFSLRAALPVLVEQGATSFFLVFLSLQCTYV